jgi:hypothetical protein
MPVTASCIVHGCTTVHILQYTANQPPLSKLHYSTQLHHTVHHHASLSRLEGPACLTCHVRHAMSGIAAVHTARMCPCSPCPAPELARHGCWAAPEAHQWPLLHMDNAAHLQWCLSQHSWLHMPWLHDNHMPGCSINGTRCTATLARRQPPPAHPSASSESAAPASCALQQ